MKNCWTLDNIQDHHRAYIHSFTMLNSLASITEMLLLFKVSYDDWTVIGNIISKTQRPLLVKPAERNST